MAKCGANYPSLFVFIFILFILSAENSHGNNATLNINFNLDTTCHKKPADTNTNGEHGVAYFNCSYPCDNNTLEFSLPTYLRDSIIDGAINPEGVLTVTVTPEGNISVLVIKIMVSDSPYDEEYKMMNTSLHNLLNSDNGIYLIPPFTPYNKKIDNQTGLVAECNTTNPNRKARGMVYCDPCNASNAHKYISIKTYLMKQSDFNELILTFRLRDERCD